MMRPFITPTVDITVIVAERGSYTTPDGGMTIFDEHPPTVWNEEELDPENLDEIDAASGGDA